MLNDRSRLDELYDCIQDDDAWVRMRAIDSLEKVCKVHPQWIAPYIDRILSDLAASTQPSIQWHIAQIVTEVDLTNEQRASAIYWLKSWLKTPDVDWIVAANSMGAAVHFYQEQAIDVHELRQLLTIQCTHKSKAVRKKAEAFLAQI